VLRHAPQARRAGRAVGARREAASHYRLALRYAAGLAPEPLARLHEHLAYECYLTDQVESAIEERRCALEIWRTLGLRLQEGDTLRWLSRFSWFGRSARGGRPVCRRGRGGVDSLPPGPELAMAYSNRAQLAMLASDAFAAIDWAQRTLGLLATAGAPRDSVPRAQQPRHARWSAGDVRARPISNAAWPWRWQGAFTSMPRAPTPISHHRRHASIDMQKASVTWARARLFRGARPVRLAAVSAGVAGARLTRPFQWSPLKPHARRHASRYSRQAYRSCSSE